MLSNEEKITLNRMKLFARISDLSVVTVKDMDIVENQSKEIEELKEKFKGSNKYMLTLSYDDIIELFAIIEELKDKNKKLKDKAKELIFEKQQLTSALLDSTPNIKIKAKIEDYEKMINASLQDSTDYGDRRRYECLEIKTVLQSLL